MIEEKIKILEERIDALYIRLEKCDLCPRNCGVNRLKGEKGWCKIGKEVVIYTSFLHHGEEPPISGKNGSGTIFFSGCNLKCIYCQNFKFSHFVRGKAFKEEELADLMLNLQDKGAHNINLVTPTHILPQIFASLLLAYRKGLELPIVYNTSGYENEEIIDLQRGIIDIYLVDLRYITSFLAGKYSFASDYPQINKRILKKIYRFKKYRWQVGLLKEGLIVRHLVLPSYIEESKKALDWIKNNFPQVLVSVMFQYQPYFKAEDSPPINRSLNYKEYLEIKKYVEKLDLDGWLQGFCPPQELAGVNFISFEEK
jgi:putative pyruvate formate lyase activating enzyme